MYVLARNEEINKWLGENPAVLGGGALVIGLLLLGFGLAALISGRSTGKYGHKFEGPMAHLHGAILTIAGAGCLIFGVVKVIGAMV
jgi:MFS family permease